MRSVRLWFTKTGAAKYISHLDLTRCLIREFRRTDIPLWYTEGFNPHAHLVFALSLPLGIEALNETVDIRLNDDSYPDGAILSTLNAVSVPGIRFTKIAEPVYKSLDVTSADYSVFIASESPKDVVDIINERIDSGSIVFQKKKKKGGFTEINVCEHIKNLELSVNKDGVCATFNLPAGNEFTVNPLSFMSALFENSPILAENTSVTRTRLLISDGTEFR